MEINFRTRVFWWDKNKFGVTHIRHIFRCSKIWKSPKYAQFCHIFISIDRDICALCVYHNKSIFVRQLQGLKIVFSTILVGLHPSGTRNSLFCPKLPQNFKINEYSEAKLCACWVRAKIYFSVRQHYGSYLSSVSRKNYLTAF